MLQDGKPYHGIYEFDNDKHIDKSEVTEKSLDPNMACECGCDEFLVCWHETPYTGGYCKIICKDCKNTLVLIDDYS